jgi:NitT/TauT family transport system permease protein
MALKERDRELETTEHPTSPPHSGSVLARAARRGFKLGAIPLLVLVIAISLWQFFVNLFDLPEYILPRPSAIVASFHGQWQPMLEAVRVTVLEAMLGYVIGNSAALIIAACMAEFLIVERSFYPYVLLLNSLPMAVVAPLLLLWIGFTIWAVVAVSALMVFFPTLVTSIAGFKATDTTTLGLMRGLNASRWQTFRYVKIMNALPYIFAALKIAVASALVGALVGEWISASKGLGYLSIQANAYVDTLLLFRVIVVVGAVAVVWFGIISVLEATFLRWHRVKSE